MTKEHQNYWNCPLWRRPFHVGGSVAPDQPRHLLWIVPLAAAALVVACSKTPGAPSTSSAVSVILTDSPFTDARALVVTFSDVSAHMSGGNWVTLPFAGGTLGVVEKYRL